jgi:tetratricopeptide (TPR) repeat protein
MYRVESSPTQPARLDLPALVDIVTPLFYQQRKGSVMSHPETIEVIGENGQCNEIPVQQWADEILPQLLKKAWDDANLLYGVISLAVDHGSADAVLEASARAFELDTIPERGSVMYSIVLTRAGKLDESEKVLNDYLAAHGDSDIILTGLAEVQLCREQTDAMEATLRKALEINPNNDRSLQLLVELTGKNGGPEAEAKMLEEMVGKPDSWRAILWQAHRAVESKDKSEAVRLYRKASERSQYDPEVLTVLSVDLGNAGYVLEMIELLEPHYSPEKHGINPGWNLVQAYLNTGQKRRGILMLNKVENLDRPELAEMFQEMRQALAKLPSEG